MVVSDAFTIDDTVEVDVAVTIAVLSEATLVSSDDFAVESVFDASLYPPSTAAAVPAIAGVAPMAAATTAAVQVVKARLFEIF